MTVKKYSVKKSGDARLSGNFRVKEFASHDGADTVLIDDGLVYILQRVRDSSNASDVVLDFFGGSGSTLIACEQLNRRCYTMELDPKYCNVIVKRWEQLTENKAILN